jgi:hypothetical protein
MYKSISGFSINFENGNIELIVDKAKSQAEAMFDSNDIYEVFSNGIDYGFFSLDQYNFTHRLHPLQKMRFNSEIAKTNFMLTMFHTDYLLKFFTTGVEMSSKYPFNFRSTSEGLLKRLPRHLQRILSPKHLDEEETTFAGNAHRFWIKANQINMHIEESQSNVVKFYFETPKMRVNKHLLKVNSSGELVDDEEGELEDYDSWESKFARNFTNHYDEIAKYFPEFDRLKQLLKLAVCQAYIRKNVESFSKNIPDMIGRRKTAISDYLKRVKESVGDWPESENSYYVDSKLDELVETHIQNAIHVNIFFIYFSLIYKILFLNSLLIRIINFKKMKDYLTIGFDSVNDTLYFIIEYFKGRTRYQVQSKYI